MTPNEPKQAQTSLVYELRIKYQTIFIKKTLITCVILQQRFQFMSKMANYRNYWNQNFVLSDLFEKTINKCGSLKVEEYPMKTIGWSLDSNAETICSNSIWIFLY